MTKLLGTIGSGPVLLSVIVSLVGFFRKKFSFKNINIFLRHQQFGMRYGGSVKKEKWLILVSINKFNRLLLNKVCRIIFLTVALIAIQHNFFLVMPQVIRIIVMGKALTIVAKELIHTLFIGITL